jgi:Zn-dependent M28 family amino/carboxypeptidase
VRLTALAAAAAFAALVVATPEPATAANAFDVALARAHTAALADLGPRREGSAAEIAGAEYVAARLEEAGYAVRTQHVRLPNGSFSHNVLAIKTGVSPRRVVLGAHLDTKGGSPGANDNGSGVGVVLELARVLKDAPTQPTIVFAFFGAEEMWDGNADHHHYGSRAYVRGLSRAQKRRISGMISVDMVGYGRYFLVRTMRLGPMTLANRLQSVAARNKLRLRFSRDPSKVGWSDHEPFEKAGIPVAWLNWKSDPLYHTPGDTAERLQDASIRATGVLIERYLTGMTARELRALRR